MSIIKALAKLLVSAALWCTGALMSLLALFWVWCQNIWSDLTGPFAYRVWVVLITTVTGAYFTLYAVTEARHDRLLNRAFFERNAFITMVSSGNRSNFTTAMKEFGPVQTVSALHAPSLMEPLRWLEVSHPNMDQLYRWALYRLARCVPEECGTVFATGESYRIDLSSANLQGARLKDTSLYQSDFRGAQLMYADLREARLLDSNLLDADLRGADLRGAHLILADLSDADLSGSDLRGADVHMAIFGVPERTVAVGVGEVIVTQERKAVRLQGADLRELKSWTPEQLAAAFWDETTVWPSGYTPPCPRNLRDGPCELS